MIDPAVTLTVPERTVSQYVEAIASNAPAPGGGSAVAVVASLGAALGEMVCQFTIGKPAYVDHELEITGARERLAASRIRFLELAHNDEIAYGEYARAAAMPKSNDAEKSTRQAALDEALQHAASVPLAAAEEILKLLTTLVPVAQFGNHSLLSDAAIANNLAEAALRGAIENVEVNARLMQSGQGYELLERSTNLVKEASALSGAIRKVLESRV